MKKRRSFSSNRNEFNKYALWIIVIIVLVGVVVVAYRYYSDEISLSPLTDDMLKRCESYYGGTLGTKACYIWISAKDKYKIVPRHCQKLTIKEYENVYSNLPYATKTCNFGSYCDLDRDMTILSVTNQYLLNECVDNEYSKSGEIFWPQYDTCYDDGVHVVDELHSEKNFYLMRWLSSKDKYFITPFEGKNVNLTYIDDSSGSLTTKTCGNCVECSAMVADKRIEVKDLSTANGEVNCINNGVVSVGGCGFATPMTCTDSEATSTNPQGYDIYNQGTLTLSGFKEDILESSTDPSDDVTVTSSTTANLIISGFNLNVQSGGVYDVVFGVSLENVPALPAKIKVLNIVFNGLANPNNKVTIEIIEVRESCDGNLNTEFICPTSNSFDDEFYDCSTEGKICQDGACVNPPTFEFVSGPWGEIPVILFKSTLKSGEMYWHHVLFSGGNNFLPPDNYIYALPVARDSFLYIDRDANGDVVRGNFIATYENGIKKNSYYLQLSIYKDFDTGENIVNIYKNYHDSSNLICPRLKEGGTCIYPETGDKILTIGNIEYNPGGLQSVEFLPTANVRFDRVYDVYGNYFDLPYNSEFPVDTYDFEIYNKYGSYLGKYHVDASVFVQPGQLKIDWIPAN